MMRVLLIALFATLLGCERESVFGDPPPGGWVNGATNAASFSGPTNPTFNFKDALQGSQQDAIPLDAQAGEDLGGPLLFDL